MLDKLVVHLKNIIFFKAIVYILIVIILSILIPIIKKDLDDSFQKKQKADVYLQDVALKLESISNFQEKIIDINKYFNQLSTKNKDPACPLRIKFIEDIKKLNTKYDLFETIKIKSSRNYNINNNLTVTNHFEISYYTVELNFKVFDFAQYLSLINDLYSFTPIGSVILNNSIRIVDGLNPSTIENLNTLKAPNNIEITLVILLRNVIYRY